MPVKEIAQIGAAIGREFSYRQAGSFYVSHEIRLGVVIARHFVVLTAFFVQPHPKAAVLRKHIFDLHCHDRADARKAVEHQADQRLVAQIDVRHAGDAIEQSAHFAGIEDRRFAFAHDMTRPAHRQRRIASYDVARHQPIEQVTDACVPSALSFSSH